MSKYIRFSLEDELFGIDILTVQEIVLPGEFRVTRVPNAPEFLVGVINLRGMIVPLVDLSVKLGFARTSIGENSRTIICKLDETRVIGVLIDSLANVIEIPKGKIEPVRSETTIIELRHIHGVFKETGALVVLVDIKSFIFDTGHTLLKADPIADAGSNRRD